MWNACTGIEMNREEMINYDTVSKRKEITGLIGRVTGIDYTRTEMDDS